MSVTIEQVMETSPVIPVLVIDDLATAAPLAQALVAGGLKVLEITLRTSCALDAISAIRKAVPDAIVGAGTVNNPAVMQQALDAGSTFMVSPGATPALIEAALSQSVPMLPGAITPSEVLRLQEYGIQRMKFFPAEAAGGIAMLKSIAGPIPEVTFCPTGGITLATAPNYLALPNVACVGGSWLAPKQLVAEGRWQEITELAAQAAALSN